MPPYPDTIFVTTQNTPLSSESTIDHYWLRNLDRQGIIKREKDASHSTRYGKNIHQLRDLGKTQFSKAPSAHPETPDIHGKISEFLMRHIIDPLG